MKGLLNFKPILKSITEHATLDDFGEIMLTSRSIHQWFLKNEDHVLMHLKKAIGDCIWYQFDKIKYQNEKICLFAVSLWPNNLRHVKNQTDDICYAAVERDGLALRHVEKQRYSLCYEAVVRNGMALKYVNEQEEMLCIEALQNNIASIQFIRKKTERIRKCFSRIHDQINSFM
jgi:hypothetical protein